MGVIRVTGPLFYFVNLERGYSDMKMNKWILAGTALTGVFAAHGALAQSTATQEVETVKEIVVKGTKRGAGPIDKETGTKSKSTIGQDFISTQSAGQTIAETLNVLPGVNFTSNDPYGSSGGDIFVRGLDNSRVSLTFDGVQLNDAGNYAIYTNQQMDPELISSASVLTMATDIDSMSASATGGTVNYTTRKAADEFGILTNLSVGDFNYKRIFALLDTGKVGPWGTKAFVAASYQKYDTFTDEPANLGDPTLEKKQVNFSIYQPVLDNGSYVSLSGHYNENRNRFIFSQNVATLNANGFYYNSAGPANVNPSNTGNLRFKSKWNLTDKLTFTADANYQYVLANGGGTSTLTETTGRIGSWTNANFKNFDANKDGVISSAALTIYNPNTTHTDRIGFQSSAIYRFNDQHTLRVNYSADRGRTTQTGEGTFVNADGSPKDVFGAKDDASIGLYGRDGSMYQRRDRYSKANVDVLSFEYRGTFFDDKLFVTIGARDQQMVRHLHQKCYSSVTGTGSSTPFCTTQAPAAVNADGSVTFTDVSGAFIRPYNTKVKFAKTLPSLGATYKVSDHGQVFVSYTENLSSPKTDQYYAITLLNGKTQVANPLPETTKGIEGGYRYNASNVTASFAVWTKDYDNRIVSSYDTATDTYFDRNVGKVKMNGWEGSFAFKPVENLSLLGGVTYTDSEVQSDLPQAKVTVAKGTDKVGDTLYIPTAGKKLVEVPEWMFNFGGTYDISKELSLTLIGKYVGERFVSDVNDATSPRYTVWNGSLRYYVPFFKQGSFLQLNAINMFDEKYYGNLSTVSNTKLLATPSGTTIRTAQTPSYNVGAPRTVMLTLSTKF